MTTQAWTIVEAATGAVLAACFLTGVEGQHPKDAGFAWDATKHVATKIPKAPDIALQTWNGTAWVDDVAKIEAALLPMVDDRRETLQMTVLTPGGAKKYVYNRKAAEAIAASGIAATVLNALTLVDRKRKYPFAYAESVVTGDALAVVLARFEAGMNVSAIENARIEAVAQKAKRDIKAATTAAAKRAAYAAINWNWSA